LDIGRFEVFSYILDRNLLLSIILFNFSWLIYVF
jgi:hypothetical protein